MPLLSAYATTTHPDPPAVLLADYAAHLTATGRANIGYPRAARAFLRSWPEPQAWADQDLPARLAAGHQTTPFVTFLMVTGRLRPGFDYLLARKLCSVWRDIAASPLAGDVQRFRDAAVELGYTATVSKAMASQVLVRLLVQTCRPLSQLATADFEEIAAAMQAREAARGRRLRHYSQALHGTRTVLFHLGVLTEPAPVPHGRRPHTYQDRLTGVPPALMATFLAYLERRRATCTEGTVSHTVSRMAHFGRHLAATDPGLASVAELDRRRHIEPYLTRLSTATRARDGAPIAISERRARIITISRFLADITQWGWQEAPDRQLLFASDIPRLPRPLAEHWQNAPPTFSPTSSGPTHPMVQLRP